MDRIMMFGHPSMMDPVLVLGTIISVVLTIIAVAVGYGLLLRFLALCDDIAAIRRQQTGTPSSLD